MHRNAFKRMIRKVIFAMERTPEGSFFMRKNTQIKKRKFKANLGKLSDIPLA